ncbi:MAG TPA: CopG family transcriptional regulator [Bryobacteraceae bacterium]|nr:CopG family transcriptional regulator [Bryobacteraceae bacterium]
MRRTQLYLEEDVWNTLHTIAHQSGTTISELVRQAVREHYVAGSAQRKRAMEAFIGIRRNRPEFADSERYVRRLRSDSRLERIQRASARGK